MNDVPVPALTPLTGKVAIVTGASGGIGAACARALARDGAAVLIHYRSKPADAEAVAAAIVADGGQAATVQADQLRYEAAGAIVQAAVDAFGKVDILVNNSGAIAFARLEALTPEIVTQQFAINAFAPLYLIQAALPHFPADGGAIVNITSNLVNAPMASAVAYSAAKAALDTMTQGFFKELAARRITVNAVAPGATRTAMTADQLADGGESDVGARTPLGRVGEPGDIAEVVAFLASPRAGWVTGQSILVDGGLTEGAFGWF